MAMNHVTPDVYSHVKKSKLDEDKEGKLRCHRTIVEPYMVLGILRRMSPCTNSIADADHLASRKAEKRLAISSTKLEYICRCPVVVLSLWIGSLLTDYGLGFNKIPMVLVITKAYLPYAATVDQHSQIQAYRHQVSLHQGAMLRNGVIELSLCQYEYQMWRASSLKLLAEKELNFLSTSWE
ncbi:hypothetical protein Tco_0018312 [Tanacetum coccineum]